MQGIIVIVGFLGAGKTTFLKKMVSEYLNSKLDPFVILNDYQNANIDARQFLDLLEPNQVNALHGSCICCSGVNELRKQVNSIPKKDNSVVLIEANGTTDACSLMGFLGVGLGDHFLPPIQVSIVDARNWQKRGYNNDLEASQIKVSSLVVLNYADSVDLERLRRVKTDINKLNPSAKIEEWKNIDSSFLSSLVPSKNEPEKIDHKKFHWSSCSVDLPDPFSSEKLKHVIESLPSSILRVKGCTRLDKDSYYSYFERIPTGETFIRPYTGNLATGPKLLTIGPGSEPGFLQSLLAD